MRKVLEEKLRLDGIRWDGLVLKPSLNRLLRGRFRFLRDQVSYKLHALLSSRIAWSEPFEEVMFGDDAEAEQSDQAMNTTEAQRGQGSPEEIAQQSSSEGDDEAPPGAADGRSDDAEGSGSDSPNQTGLGDVPHVEPEATATGAARL